MQWYEILSIFGFPTLATLIIGDIYARVKLNSKKFKEKRKNEHQEELKTVVREVVKEEIKPLENKIDKVDTEVSQIRNVEIKTLYRANRDSLRNQLYQLYDRCELQGYKTSTDIDNEAHMFRSYTDLGGNSGTVSRHENFETIDTEKEFLRKKKTKEN